MSELATYAKDATPLYETCSLHNIPSKQVLRNQEGFQEHPVFTTGSSNFKLDALLRFKFNHFWPKAVCARCWPTEQSGYCYPNTDNEKH